MKHHALRATDLCRAPRPARRPAGRLASGPGDTARQLGSALGLSVVVAVITATTGPDPAAQVAGHQAATFTTVAFAVAGLIVAVLTTRTLPATVATVATAERRDR